MGVKGFTGLLLTMTSMKASRVRVLPVPGGPCTPCVASDTDSKGGLTSKKKKRKFKKKKKKRGNLKKKKKNRMPDGPCTNNV